MKHRGTDRISQRAFYCLFPRSFSVNETFVFRMTLKHGYITRVTVDSFKLSFMEVSGPLRRICFWPL